MIRSLKTIIAHLLYGRRLNRAMMLGDQATAMRLLDRYVAIDPTSPDFINLRGRVLTQYGDQEQAKRDFDNSFRLAEEHPPGPTVLSRMYGRRGWAKRFLNDLENALQDLSEAIRLNPANSEARYIRVETYFDLKAYREAIEDCQYALNSIQMSPKNQIRMQCVLLHARFEAEIAPPEIVLQELNRLARSYPPQSVPYYTLLLIYLSKHRYPEALETINHLIKLEPGILNHYITRGIIHHMLHNQQAAAADCRKVLAQTPNDALALNNLGYILLIQGNLEEAESLIEKSIEQDHRLSYAFGSRGHLRFLQGNYEAGLADFRHGRELNYDDGSRQTTTAGEAITLYQMGKIEEARALWQILREQDASFCTAQDFDIANVWAEPCAKLAHLLIAETSGAAR